MTAFEWSEQAEKAAQLLAAGDLGVVRIAVECGTTQQTLWNWRQRPEFTARVEECQTEIRAEVRRHGIAIVEQRLASLDDRWRRLHQIMNERAAEPDMRDVPGGESGLLVRTYKSVGSGPRAEKVEEYKVDTGLLAELREHEKQVAQELGQWIAKTDVTKHTEVTVLRFPIKELHAGNPAEPGPPDPSNS